jgi:hypothetical protein
MSWAQHEAGMKEMRYKNLFRKPERKRPLGRPTRRWEDNIRFCLIEIGIDRIAQSV